MNRSIIRWVTLGALILSFSVASFGQVAVGISVRVGPPALPIYAQPICPGPGYIWTPGYWAWNDDDGYYWVPGTWVVAPMGMYWTPGYWGWGGGFYMWHPGYWGPHVGFYGGINYGFGYTGVGFFGGEWRGGAFYYNRSVTNVSVTNVTNVYNRTVIVNNRSTTSFNGGTGGIQARPTRQEEDFARERHTGALEVQSQHERMAAQNRENFAAQNHGRPAIAATTRPADFGRRSVVAARAAGGEYRAPAIPPREARVNPSNVNRPNMGSTPGNPPRDNGNRRDEGFRPFTPPAKNNGGNARGNDNYNRNQGSGSNSRGNDNRFNENRPPQRREVAPPVRETPRPAPQRSSPPPHSSPAPHYNPPPREAPQQHQAPPPPQHRDHGKQR